MTTLNLAVSVLQGSGIHHSAGVVQAAASCWDFPGLRSAQADSCCSFPLHSEDRVMLNSTFVRLALPLSV